MEMNNATIELDGRLMTSRSAAHEHIRKALNFPAFYGNNLDALYDLLTEHREARSIILLHTDEMTGYLGAYASALLKTLLDAAEKNPSLTVYCPRLYGQHKKHPW